MFQWITLYENWSSCITFLQTKLHTMLILSWLIPGDSLVANNANLSTYILHVCHNIIMSRLWNKGRDRVRDSYFCQRTPEESQYFVSLNRRGSPGTPNFQFFYFKASMNTLKTVYISGMQYNHMKNSAKFKYFHCQEHNSAASANYF